jgi:hypothetical protein
LVQAVVPPPGQQASPTYLDLYATTLNVAMKPLLGDPQAGLRPKLNAAIVTARVATRMNNPRLAEAATLLMNDQSEAVALWGVKAAKAVIPSVLANPLQQTKVLETLAPTVEKFPSGPVVQEAYEALNLLSTGRTGMTSAMITAAAQQMIPLLKVRVGQYVRGMPDEPTAERIPAVYLSDSRVWGPAPNELKRQILEQLCHVASVMGQRSAANPGDRGKLTATLKTVADALSVIADQMTRAGVAQAAGLKQAATALSAGVSAGDGSALQQLTNAVVVAAQNVKDYGPINNAPTIQAGAAGAPPVAAAAITTASPPAPATAPSR